MDGAVPNFFLQLSIGKQWKEFLDYSETIGFIFHVSKPRYHCYVLLYILFSLGSTITPFPPIDLFVPFFQDDAMVLDRAAKNRYTV